MNYEIIVILLQNILILMSLIAIYSAFPTEERENTIIKEIILGFAVFFIGIVIMTNSLQLGLGAFYDSRGILLSISGMFLGFIPTIISVVFLVIFRVIVGGTGYISGILIIIFSGLIGLLWRYFKLRNSPNLKINIVWYKLYAFNLFIQVVCLLSFVFIKQENNMQFIKSYGLYIIIIFPLGGFVLSSFMQNQRNTYLNNLHIEKSEIQYRNLFEKSKAMLLLIDFKTGQIVDVNKEAIKNYGYSFKEFTSKTIYEINILPNEEIREAMKNTKANTDNHFLFQHQTKNKNIIDVEIYSTPVDIGQKKFIYSTIFDITKSNISDRELKDTQIKLKETLLSVGEGIISTDTDGKITLLNNNAENLLNISAKKSINKNISSVFHLISEEFSKSFDEHLNNVLNNQQTIECYENCKLKINNNYTYINYTLSPIIDKNNTVYGSILVFRDVTADKEKQEEIQYISQHDHLTGLYNRYHFEKEMKRLNISEQLPLSLIIGDVNGLKLLNDTFSHLEGDLLLQEVSRIIKVSINENNIASRWGGDEFAILLPKTELDDAEKVIDRIMQECKKSDYNTITPSISLGASTKYKISQDIYSVLKKAEEKMYREKLQEGKSMRNGLITTLENTLREKSNETKMHAQRMISLSKHFAKELNLDIDTTNSLTLLARLHDIGKITVSDEILRSTKKLSEDEWRAIKNHPIAGSRIVKSIPELHHISDGILYHHEHFDGSGYPHSLKGHEIPLISRMVAIIDAYEVMTSGRNYSSSITQKAAIRELIACKGKQFDPTLVDIFIKSIKKSK